MNPLEMYISQILDAGISLGLSESNVKIVRYTNVESLFYLSYAQPTVQELAIYPKDIIWVCADPDSPKYKTAFRSSAFFPGLWDKVNDVNSLMRTQASFFTEFVHAPADTLKEEQFHAPLLPRTLEVGESYGENEVVPLSFIRTLIGDGGGGGEDPNLTRRVDILEQEVLRLESELENIDTTYNHKQNSVSATWRVEHGFGQHPSIIQVQNESGCPVFPENIVYDSSKPNEFLVVFSTPELGSVACVR